MIEKQIEKLKKNGFALKKELDRVREDRRILNLEGVQIASRDIDTLKTFYYSTQEEIDDPRLQKIRIQLDVYDNIIRGLGNHIWTVNKNISDLTGMLNLVEDVTSHREEHIQVKSNNGI